MEENFDSLCVYELSRQLGKFRNLFRQSEDIFTTSEEMYEKLIKYCSEDIDKLIENLLLLIKKYAKNKSNLKFNIEGYEDYLNENLQSYLKLKGCLFSKEQTNSVLSLKEEQLLMYYNYSIFVFYFIFKKYSHFQLLYYNRFKACQYLSAYRDSFYEISYSDLNVMVQNIDFYFEKKERTFFKNEIRYNFEQLTTIQKMLYHHAITTDEVYSSIILLRSCIESWLKYSVANLKLSEEHDFGKIFEELKKKEKELKKKEKELKKKEKQKLKIDDLSKIKQIYDWASKFVHENIKEQIWDIYFFYEIINELFTSCQITENKIEIEPEMKFLKKLDNKS